MSADLWGSTAATESFYLAKVGQSGKTLSPWSALSAGSVCLPLSVHKDKIKDKAAALQVLCWKSILQK